MTEVRMFICPDCYEKSTAIEWNEATENDYGKNISKIDYFVDRSQHYYICPKCDEDVHGMDIETISC